MPDAQIFEEFISRPRLAALRVENGRIIATRNEISAKKDSYVGHLYEVTLDGPPVQLTHSAKGESLSAIGEDGTLFFTSKRSDDGADDADQGALWALPAQGEARVVMRRRGGFSSLVARGGKLFATAPVLPSAADEDVNEELLKERKERGVTGVLHEAFPIRYWDHDLGPAYDRLFSIDPQTFEMTELPTAPGRLQGFQVSDDGKIVLQEVEDTRGTTPRHRVYMWREGSAPTKLPIEARAPFDVFAGPVSPDNKHAIVVVNNGNLQGFPMACWAEVVNLETLESRRLVPGFTDWPGTVVWLDENRVAFDADRLGRRSIYVARMDCDEPILLTDDDFTYHLAGVVDGKIIATKSAVNRAPGMCVIDDGEVRDLAPLTEESDAFELVEVQARGEDGTALRAWLALPREIPEGGAPLAVFIHGGPWGSWNDWTWRWNPSMFTEGGYAVLLPDPAISTGYGQAMIDRGSDELGGAPFTDILALIDAAEARADVNGERTAILGGSYGGYMANWFAGHTGKRFSCIVSHAALWDIDAMSRSTDNGVWHEWMRESQAEQYSPDRFAENIEVPMLVIHGDKDYRVPFSQGLSLWHDLLRYSKVEGHKFLYFPDENHWILKPSNSALWYETVRAFVDSHVYGKNFERPRLLG